MGYPFDRRLPAANLQALTTSFSNMAQTNVNIIFNNRIIQ